MAAIVLAGLYFVAFSPIQAPQAAEDFTFKISIQVSNGTAFSFVIPPAIGVAGGIWRSHQYDQFGLSGHYPLYTDQPPANYSGYSIVHVRSSVVRQYYLGDFFAVWGEPIGYNNTLGIPARNSFFWDMCVGGPGNVRPGNWGGEFLVKDLPVELRYSNNGCI